MAQIEVRLGDLGDVDDAVSVYERSNLARRQGDWPSRSARVAQVTASLHDAAGHDASWFLIGREGTEAVAMALIHPFRAGGGNGDVIPGTWFLSLIYVLPERWGTGIGGRLLDAVIDEAKRRGGHHIYDTAGELPMGAILSEGRYSPTWRYGFYVEHGCGGLACWFRMHATRLIDQK